MVVYVNESYYNGNGISIDSIINEYNIEVNNIYHESNIALMEYQYNYLVENGYEMPLNEAEEKKDNIFKKMINALVNALRRLKEKLVNWCKSHFGKNKNKQKEAIKKIDSEYKDGKRKIESSKTVEEAKKASDSASSKMKSNTEYHDYKVDLNVALNDPDRFHKEFDKTMRDPKGRLVF